MTVASRNQVSYNANPLTIAVDATPAEFRARYEEPVPPLPVAEIKDLITRGGDRQAMRELVLSSASLGFVMYDKNDLIDPMMHLAGDEMSCVSYLMGVTGTERLFRHDQSVMLYSPLRTVVRASPTGSASFAFDRSSDQFASFTSSEIASAGWS
jgi:hypothetical protein